MKARYYRNGRVFATYRLDGDSENAQALRLMAWVMAGEGWDWRIS